MQHISCRGKANAVAEQGWLLFWLTREGNCRAVCASSAITASPSLAPQTNLSAAACMVQRWREGRHDAAMDAAQSSVLACAGMRLCQ